MVSTLVFPLLANGKKQIHLSRGITSLQLHYQELFLTLDSEWFAQGRAKKLGKFLKIHLQYSGQEIMTCTRGVTVVWKEQNEGDILGDLKICQLIDVDKEGELEEESMMIERIMISQAESKGSEGVLEIKDDKYDLWQSKRLDGN